MFYYIKKRKQEEKKTYYFLHSMHIVLSFFFFLHSLCICNVRHASNVKTKREERERRKQGDREKTIGEYSD